MTVEFLQKVDQSKLSQIANVIQVKNLDAKRWQLIADAKEDIRADVFQFAVANNLTLLEMRKEVFSVENVFQKLTK